MSHINDWLYDVHRAHKEPQGKPTYTFSCILYTQAKKCKKYFNLNKYT
jgi:hypothetical protein